MEIPASPLETGEKYLFEIADLNFQSNLPYVLLPVDDGLLKIASFNLVGMIEWNRIFGRELARRIREKIGRLEGVVFLTAVEKSLQLAQVVAQELDLPMMAIAYNRRKPHMEIDAGARLIAWLIQSLSLSPQAVFGYKELAVTQSPGNQWDTGAMWGTQLRQRIQDYLAGIV